MTLTRFQRAVIGWTGIAVVLRLLFPVRYLRDGPVLSFPWSLYYWDESARSSLSLTMLHVMALAVLAFVICIVVPDPAHLPRVLRWFAVRRDPQQTPDEPQVKENPNNKTRILGVAGAGERASIHSKRIKSPKEFLSIDPLDLPPRDLDDPLYLPPFSDLPAASDSGTVERLSRAFANGLDALIDRFPWIALVLLIVILPLWVIERYRWPGLLVYHFLHQMGIWR
jgi:hypothetical protein